MSKSTIVKLSTIVEKWGYSILSEEERQLFLHQEQLHIAHGRQLRDFPKGAPVEELMALNDAQIAERKPLTIKIADVTEQMKERINKLTDDQVEQLFIDLGLLPLLTLENYTITREHLLECDPLKARTCITTYIKNANSVRLETIHFLLRPGSSSSYKISNQDWLNTEDDTLRREQCLDRLTVYSDNSLPKLLIHLVDEELSQLWVEGVTEHAVLTHPMFWDVTDDSSLPTNPDYIQRNTEAIRTALAKGEIALPTLLLQAAQMKSNDFLLLPQEVVKQHDLHAALLVDHIDDERRTRRMSLTDNTWSILGSRVRENLKAGIELLIENPTVPSLQYLIDRLVGISYLMQEYTATNTMNSFLIELVAKSIKMYLLGNKEPFGSMHTSSYTFLLTSEKPEQDSRHIGPEESIWGELVDRIIEVLNTTDNDGQVILQLIQARTLPEVAKIVEYDLG